MSSLIIVVQSTAVLTAVILAMACLTGVTNYRTRRKQSTLRHSPRRLSSSRSLVE